MNTNDEIDLGLVFSKFLKKWGDRFSIFNNTLKKRKLLIIGLSIFGALFSGLYYTTKSPVYISEMVLTSKTLSNQYCLYLIDVLKKIQNDNLNEFAQKLNIGTEVAEKIADIEYTKFDEKLKESKDSLVYNMPFKIRLSVYDPSVIDTMETLLTSYLENNEYALKRKNIGIEYRKKVISKLREEMPKIDSLRVLLTKRIEYRESTQKSSGVLIESQMDPLNAYNEALNLYKQELQLNNELLIPENIIVIEGFTPKTQPDSPVLLVDLLSGLLLGFILSIIIALRLEK